MTGTYRIHWPEMGIVHGEFQNPTDTDDPTDGRVVRKLLLVSGLLGTLTAMVLTGVLAAVVSVGLLQAGVAVTGSGGAAWLFGISGVGVVLVDEIAPVWDGSGVRTVSSILAALLVGVVALLYVAARRTRTETEVSLPAALLANPRSGSLAEWTLARVAGFRFDDG